LSPGSQIHLTGQETPAELPHQHNGQKDRASVQRGLPIFSSRHTITASLMRCDTTYKSQFDMAFI
jgi:hypothetical protein